MHAGVFVLLLCALSAFADPPPLSPARLAVESWPPGAIISIDSAVTGKRTPARFDSLVPGVHEVIIRLRDYHFERRMIDLLPGTRNDLSFRLIAVTDAQKVVGSDRIGALMLPSLPIDSPYHVDDDPAYPGTIVLDPGRHTIRWDGGLRYASLDTAILVEPGKATLLAFVPRERRARLIVRTHPLDAILLLDRIRVDSPLDSLGVHAGSIRITALRSGFRERDTTLTLSPDDTVSLTFPLLPSLDADEDGFADSVDLCRDRFGIHDGCPERPRSAGLKLALRTVRLATVSAPFSFSFSAASVGARTPVRRDFRELLSLCSDGPPFLSGARGISVLNEAELRWRALSGGIEWSQSILGAAYTKGATAFAPFEQDTLVLISDTVGEVEVFPRILMPAITLHIGARLSWHGLGMAWNLGYRFETLRLERMGTKIAYDSLMRTGGNRDTWMTRAESLPARTIDNNHWFQSIRADWEIPLAGRTRPVFFAELVLPFAGTSFTNWTSLRAGLEIRTIPLRRT